MPAFFSFLSPRKRESRGKNPSLALDPRFRAWVCTHLVLDRFLDSKWNHQTGGRIRFGIEISRFAQLSNRRLAPIEMCTYPSPFAGMTVENGSAATIKMRLARPQGQGHAAAEAERRVRNGGRRDRDSNGTESDLPLAVPMLRRSLRSRREWRFSGIAHCSADTLWTKWGKR